MSDFYGVIYKVTNLVNGKIYIGQTKQDFYKRKRYHLFCLRNGCQFVFYRAMRKYGLDNFEWEIIDEAHNEKDIIQKEIYWIDFYKSYIYAENSNGYNMTIGGEGTKGRIVSDETRKRLSVSKSGKNHPFYGKKHSENHKQRIADGNKGKFVSEETRKKMSDSQIDGKHWNYGGTISDEHKKAISNANSGENHHFYGKNHSDETKEKIRKTKIGRFSVNGRDREILQINSETGIIIREFKSLKETLSFTGADNTGNISNCCIGKRKTAYGYIWMYKDSYNQDVLDERINNVEPVKIANLKNSTIIKLDINGNFVSRHNTAKDGADSVNGDKSAIIKCCKGKAKTHKGYKWIYEEDYKGDVV